METGNAELTVDSNYSDPNRFAFALWILQACLFRRLLLLEGLRQGRKLPTDVLEEQPPLDDFGHAQFIAQASPTCGTCA